MEQVAPEERLFSLVLALVATKRGLTKGEILSTVRGYRERSEARVSTEALERQFERDKDDLRELGIPLETVEAPEEAGSNHHLRYRIPKGEYDLPDDIRFTREEATLLALAAQVWREGSLSSESHRALTKLRSLGIDTDDPTLGYAPRIGAREPAFEPLRAAVDKHLVVRFPYLKPGERAATVRTVEPLALVQHSGRWHLVSHDRDRGARRTFLLSRIVGAVQATRTVFDPPEGDPAAEALADLDRILAAGRVVVRVEPGSDAELRLRRRALETRGDAELVLAFGDGNLVADELASYGPEVTVLEPADIRKRVIARLRRTLRDHEGKLR